MPTQVDIERFYIDHNIDNISEGHKHCSRGWIQIHCPICDDDNYHLGFNTEKSFFRCWRCGWIRIEDVISALLSCSISQAQNILRRYSSDRHPVKIHEEKHKTNLIVARLPKECTKLTSRHKRYLESRKFIADQLEEKWQLKGTGPIGPYKFRIVAPIHFERRIVSFQGRDITEKSKLKYKACARENEARPHKHCLYGLDQVPKSSIVVCEGIADVWRLGFGSVATFGKQVVRTQINLLRRFKNRYIFFDKDAKNDAKTLAKQLSAFEGSTEIITDNKFKDPADMDQDYANAIMHELAIF